MEQEEPILVVEMDSQYLDLDLLWEERQEQAMQIEIEVRTSLFDKSKNTLKTLVWAALVKIKARTPPNPPWVSSLTAAANSFLAKVPILILFLLSLPSTSCTKETTTCLLMLPKKVTLLAFQPVKSSLPSLNLALAEHPLV